MLALVSVETVLLVVLIVLVAGLLRSHAELLRRVGPPDGAGRRPGAPEAAGMPAGPLADPPRIERPDLHPAPIAGTTPAGDAIKLDFAGPARGPTLLAFLTSGCSTCARFWEGLASNELPAGVEKVIVTRGGERERPGRLRSLAPENVPVVMSTQAWDDYAVPGSPYFLLVDREIRGEGVATTWDGLASLVGDAIEEDERLREGVSAGTRRARQVDETLAAHGIGPDHPSLYPAGARERERRP